MEKPDLNKPFFKMFPNKAELVKENKCSFCGNAVTEFKDSLSRKEYGISGMCQSCQDKVFR